MFFLQRMQFAKIAHAFDVQQAGDIDTGVVRIFFYKKMVADI
jgi:hypothetical protein